MTGIYKITSPSGKVYIGQSWHIEARFKHYKALDCKGQRKLYNSLKKYGFNNHTFDILEWFLEISQRQLDKKEQEYIKFYLDKGFTLLNLTSGGYGGKLSEETKRLMSIQRIGNKSNTGRKLSEEHKQNISKGLQGKVFNSDHLRKYSKVAVEKSKKITSKKVHQFTLNNVFIKTYASVKEASRQTNIKHQNICNCALGKQKQSGNFIWKYE